MQPEATRSLYAVRRVLHGMYNPTGVDLHKHSYTEDKTRKTVEEAIINAVEDGCSAVAITDHDTMSFVSKFMEKYGLKQETQYDLIWVPAGTKLSFSKDGKEHEFITPYDIGVMPAVELSAKLIEPNSKIRSVHLLAYALPIYNLVFLDELRDKYTYPRQGRMRNMGELARVKDKKMLIPTVGIYTRNELGVLATFVKDSFTPPVMPPDFGRLYEHLETVYDAIEDIRHSKDQAKSFNFHLRRLREIMPEMTEEQLFSALANMSWEVLEKPVQAMFEFFEPYSPKQSFVGYEYLPTVQDTLDFVESWGGACVLAHGANLLSSLSKEQNIDELLEELQERKLIGLEIVTHKHTREQMMYLINIARKNKMIGTGGSDGGDYTLKVRLPTLESLLVRLLKVHGY